MYFLREYLQFVDSEHITDPALARMFPVIVTDKHAVLPLVYKSSEIASAIAEIGRKPESPLRVRAVTLLASLVGLRSSGVKGLRFDQFDWANRRLLLTQSKTGRRLDLP